MDSKRFKEVDNLLQAVLERPPEERETFLDPVWSWPGWPCHNRGTGVPPVGSVHLFMGHTTRNCHSERALRLPLRVNSAKRRSPAFDGEMRGFFALLSVRMTNAKATGLLGSPQHRHIPGWPDGLRSLQHFAAGNEKAKPDSQFLQIKRRDSVTLARRHGGQVAGIRELFT
jgi:hypothetical protein